MARQKRKVLDRRRGIEALFLSHSSFSDGHGTCRWWLDGAFEVGARLCSAVQFITERKSDRFIETHFADMFRLLPEAMPYLGSREEKWISSSTLLEAPELITTPARDPKTPEPNSGGALLPSFALSSPSGKSPQSIKTHSSPGSPLTALQFLRRVDGEESFLRPATPLKSSPLRNHSRASLATLKSPNGVPVWKP